jgi:uncharacterized protein (TIGR03083 family)
MQLLEPVFVLDLFLPVHQGLLQLLTRLNEEEWYLPTICTGWSVKDIALHLLGDDIGLLSRKRDGFDPFEKVYPQRHIDSWNDLVAYLNEMNALWVQATRRISCELLCSLLMFTGEETYRYFTSLDPSAIGDRVSWAGPDPAPVWLDIAREYTERWVHQQQIRDAVNKPGLKERRFLAPVLETFVRALPHTFREIQAGNGTHIHLIIAGDAGSAWSLLRENDHWVLGKTAPAPVAASVSMDQETAWRLFTKGISKDEALQYTTFKGDQTLGLKVLDMVSIIA